MTNRMSPEEEFNVLKQGIEKAMMILDGYPTCALFTCEDYMKLYDCVYDMCIQHPPYVYSAQLYQIFKKALEDSIIIKVIPALKDKTDTALLYELCNMWTKYKVMAKCLGGFFMYLDRHFVEETKTASLNSLSISCFHDRVCSELYPKLLETTICLINQERDETSVCRDLLINVSTFFVEIGNGKMHYYDIFETEMLKSTANYYNHLVPQLLVHHTPDDYLVKVQYCLSQEKERASQFLHQTSVEKLLQVVHEHLWGQTALKLHGKHFSECGDYSPYKELLKRCAGLNLGEGTSEV